MTKSGLTEVVYNDFFIGEDCDVTIVAGCGIDNCGPKDSEHDGIHRFYVGKNARVRYVEKHYGSGDGSGKRILNPVTEVYMEEDSSVEMEMVQIKGVDDTERTTTAELAAGAKLVVRERLMTHGSQRAISTYVVSLNGEGCSADVVSRSVARDNSFQKFDAVLLGSAACSGHTECDSIIMDNGRILAVPGLEANDVDAALVHEAAIGKIAGDQIIKLMTLGLTEQEAEEQIINGFLDRREDLRDEDAARGAWPEAAAEGRVGGEEDHGDQCLGEPLQHVQEIDDPHEPSHPAHGLERFRALVQHVLRPVAPVGVSLDDVLFLQPGDDLAADPVHFLFL